MKLLLTLVAVAPLMAASVDTVLLGTGTSSTVVTSDAQGNLIHVRPPSCSDCGTFTAMKMDAQNRVVFRRMLGDDTWRFVPKAAAVDGQGNIVIAGTASHGLPLTRPVQAAFGGGSADVYVLQLSPDASRILFSTYLGGSAGEDVANLQLDSAGNILLQLRTDSTDYPFTARYRETRFPRTAVVRIAPATGDLRYAIGFLNIPDPRYHGFGVDPDGTVLLTYITAVPTSEGLSHGIVEIRPDGSLGLRPTPIQAGAGLQRVAAASDGGMWVAGFAARGQLPPVGPNAWQGFSSAPTYERTEGSLPLTPPGPMTDQTVEALAVDRANDNTIYALTLRGIFRSSNNGWTWELRNQAFGARYTMTITAGPGRLWAVSWITSSGLADLTYSDDGGASWTAARHPPVTGDRLVAANPVNPNELYISSGNTLHRTLDAGRTWTSRQLPVSRISALAADAKHVAIAARPLNDGPQDDLVLFLSTDGGVSFLKGDLRLGVPFGVALDFDPNQPGSLYVAGARVLMRTDPGTFPTFEPLLSNPWAVRRIGFQPGLPGVVYGVDLEGRAYLRSSDGGRSFQTLYTDNRQPRPFKFSRQLVVGAGGVIHTVFEVSSEPYLAKIDRNGDIAFLTYLGLPSGGFFQNLIVDPADRVVLTGFAGTSHFPGKRLSGITPPDGSDAFAVAFEADGGLAYAYAIGGDGDDWLSWSGLGPNGSLLLAGSTSSRDFPGVAGRLTESSQFFSRLTP